MPKPYTPNDKWSQKAAELGYRARSVFKLMELDERYKLLRPGMNVLDLGAAPGSWLQYASERVGTKGIAIGLDLEAIEPIAKNVRTAKADALNPTEVRGKASGLPAGRIIHRYSAIGYGSEDERHQEC